MNERASSTEYLTLVPVPANPEAAVADAPLLERFVHEGDEDAFACLVQRYGRMVLAVCRRVLRHQQDAEDAAQDAFLLLARKGASIRAGESVRGWLYTAAYRLSLRARAKSARRAHDRMLPEDIADDEPGGAPADRLAWRELCQWLDAKLSQIPEKYRTAFILCQLEGKTCAEAAAVLGCPRGTVRSRVGRAKRRLLDQLSPSALRNATPASS
jgi:RNA polymerase sigma factor (sigma-70 family)